MLDKIVICPICKNELSSLNCKCGYMIEEENGVFIFPSKIVNTFRGYCKQTNLEQYNKKEPNIASDYYPRYIQDDALNILDVGGGDGMALANVAKENSSSNIYVVDADFENLQRVPKRGLTNLKAFNCSATKLPFKDSSIDIVFTLFMVEHMYDEQYSDFLIEARRVLKEDGKLIVATDGDIYDKWIHPFQRFLNPKEKFATSGFLEKHNHTKVAINHHNLKSPYQTRDFIQKHNFFIQNIRLHLIGGRKKLGALAYEILIPKIIAQKFLSTMFIVIARKNH